MVTENCWLCPSTFDSKRDLKNHLTKAPHQAFQVVCPFCTDAKRVLRRMVDLKTHCKTEHARRLKDLPEKFFAESNGYWLATSPHNYGRALEVPAYNDQLAITTRIKMLEWVKQCRDNDSRQADWEAGWESRGRTSTVQDTPTSESAFCPDYNDESDTELTLTTTPRKRHMTPTTPVPYDPVRPSMDDGLVLHWITTSPQGITAELYLPGGAIWYIASVSLPSEGSDRLLASMSRRMLMLKPDEMSKPTGDGILVEGNRFHTLQGKVASALRIERRLVRSISSLRSKVRAAVKAVGQVPRTPPKEPETSDTRCDDTNQTLDSPNNDDNTNNVSDDEGENNGTRNDVLMDSDDNSDDKDSDDNSDDNSDDKDSDDNDEDNDHGDTEDKEQDTKENKNQATTEGINQDTLTTKPSAISSIVVRLPLRRPATRGLSREDRARRILMTGCMPLIPPGRRSWDSDEVELDTATGTLTWPPKEWKAYNQDQRLLAWEYVAMSMFLASRSTSALTIPSDRANLLDRYNMLALPGTPPPSNPMTTKRKARYYNYDVLRQIANGFFDDDTDDLISCIERAMDNRNDSTDIIYKKIKDIPLRLTDD